MSIYEAIDEDTLQYQLKVLRSLLDAWVQTEDETILGYAVLCLYEYMVCYSKFVLSNKVSQTNVKATVDDIKQFLQGGNSIANYLRSIRNCVGHAMKYDIVKLIKFLKKADVLDQLQKFDLSEDIVRLLTDKDSIIKECIEYLSTLDIKDKTIGEVYSVLGNKFTNAVAKKVLSSHLMTYTIVNPLIGDNT